MVKNKKIKKIWSSTKIEGKNNEKFALKCQKQGWPIHQVIRAEIWYFPQHSPPHFDEK